MQSLHHLLTYAVHDIDHMLRYLLSIYLSSISISRNIHFGDEARSFRRIPALLAEMRKAGAHTAIETDDVARFLRCWVVPKATKQAFAYCRKFVAMDGTFTKARHKLVLLAVIAVDGNGETLPIAWGLVRVENTLNWDWFLHGIRLFFDGLEAEDAVIISDRQKGLEERSEEKLPTSHS